MDKQERSYEKEKYKSNPSGIRFNLAQEKIALAKAGVKTRQKLVDFLLDRFVNGENPVLERQQPAQTIQATNVAIPKNEHITVSYEPINQIQAYKQEMNEARNFDQLVRIVGAMKKDNSISWKQKPELEQFAEQIIKERGFYNE